MFSFMIFSIFFTGFVKFFSQFDVLVSCGGCYYSMFKLTYINDIDILASSLLIIHIHADIV